MTGMKSKPTALRSERERKGHTLTSLAALARVSKQWLSELEGGAVGLSPPTAKRIAEALDVDIEDIATISDESAEVAS